MVGTVLIVASLDFQLGRKQAFLNVVANFAGGVSSVIVLVLLAIQPTLATFTLLLLASALLFGRRIFRGDPMAPLLVVACNGYLIVLRQQPAFGCWNVLGVADARQLLLPRRPVHAWNDGAALASNSQSEN